MTHCVDQVRELARKTPKEEICGFIVATDFGEEIYPTKNVSSQPTRGFEISAEEFVRASKGGRIVATYHSHPSNSVSPSDIDKRTCYRSGLPMLIVSSISGQSEWVKPESDDFKLEGRIFAYGVFDCYELVRDYYRLKLGIDLPVIASEEGWWNRGQNLFLENVTRCNLVEVPGPTRREHDILLLQYLLRVKVPHHLAVYVGDSEILHQPMHQFSGRTLYGNSWRLRTRHTLRHQKLMKPGDVFYSSGETLRWK